MVVSCSVFLEGVKARCQNPVANRSILRLRRLADRFQQVGGNADVQILVTGHQSILSFLCQVSNLPGGFRIGDYFSLIIFAQHSEQTVSNLPEWNGERFLPIVSPFRIVCPHVFHEFLATLLSVATASW